MEPQCRQTELRWSCSGKELPGPPLHIPIHFDIRTRVREKTQGVGSERDIGLTGGHVLHAEPGLDQWFAWRPLLGHARYRFGLPGLYLCGSGAHAGGGVTGGAGENAARAIAADL